VGPIEHCWPVIWLACCLAGALLAIGAALVGLISGEQAAEGCLAFVSIGVWPMLMYANFLTRWVRVPMGLALVGAGLWFGFCAVGVMSPERGADLVGASQEEAGRFVGGLSHEWEKPTWKQPPWIKPGSQPIPIPLSALREQLRREGRLNE
jgi:hypothetical protein